MPKLFIDGKRSGYAPEQCNRTMTVKELINALENAISDGELEENSPIYLANDRGYTFGEISEWDSFSIGESFEEAEDYRPIF